MGKFFENYADEGGGSWVSSEEKQVLIDSGVIFPVVSVSYIPETKFGPRYVLGIELEDEPRLLGFGAGSVDSRDRLLSALKEYFEDDDSEPEQVVLVKEGRSILIRSASGGE